MIKARGLLRKYQERPDWRPLLAKRYVERWQDDVNFKGSHGWTSFRHLNSAQLVVIINILENLDEPQDKWDRLLEVFK